MSTHRFVAVLVLVAIAVTTRFASAQAGAGTDVPPLAAFSSGSSELRDVIDRYSSDRNALSRSYPVRLSASRYERLMRFDNEWVAALLAMDFDGLSHDGQIDWILLHNDLQRNLRQLAIRKGYADEAEKLMPFAPTIIALAENRREMRREDGDLAAATLTELNAQIKDVRKRLEAGLKGGEGRKPEDGDRGAKPQATSRPQAGGPQAASAPGAQTSPDQTNGRQIRPDEVAASQPDPIRVERKVVANRAARMVRDLRNSLRDWYEFHNGYDPLFTWWMAEPYKQVDKTLDEYARFLRVQVVGVAEDDDKTIIGDPIGREALLSELQFEMIPYTPEELIEIANIQFRWCQVEMLKASNELGFGDDWRQALESVKRRHVQPGEQPAMVKALALEAIKFLDDHDLVTVPPLCREIWRMDMMSPQQQMMSPFFLGGEVIQVAFPTDAMSHEAKQMTLRGNNRHFAHATVFHELIPGHHLQGFMTERYRQYRQLFDTPFWVEGWALYWEMLMWDQGFHTTAEDRAGALFWRMHRCARIIFSLSFHLDRMSPQECVDFLVDNVGHERANAEAEVRRSFEGDYGPLYQVAYMLGGLQLRALHQELVDSGKLTNRQFHDAILRENSIPIEMVRAILTNQNMSKDFVTTWRFADEP